MSEFEEELRKLRLMEQEHIELKRQEYERESMLISRKLELEGRRSREQAGPLICEMMPQLGNAIWGEGNFNYTEGDWVISKFPDRRTRLEISIYLAFSYPSRDPFLVLNLPPNTSNYTQQKVLNVIQTHKNLDFGKDQMRGNVVEYFSYDGKIIMDPPFDRESITAMFKAAAIIGPRKVFLHQTYGHRPHGEGI